MDLLELIDDHWFGRRADEQLHEPEEQAPLLRRGSAGSLSDAAAVSEQDEAATAARRREPHRRQPSNSQPAAAKRLPRPLLNGRRSRDEEGDGGVLGTWAGRQRIFSEHLRQQEAEAHSPAAQQQQQQHKQHKQQEQANGVAFRPSPAHIVDAPAAASAAAGTGAAAAAAPSAHEPQHGETPVVLAPPPLPGRGGRGQPAAAEPGGDGSSLDEEVHAAWRWRFTRKWQAEQLAALEAGAAPEGEDEEEWAAALRLMDAVEGGLNMQIGRTLSLHNSSMEPGGSMDPGGSMSLALMSPGLSQLLLDGSVKESPLREEAATAQIVSVARKAQHLRLQQQEIERQVSERWEAAAGGGPWVAQHLPAVQIDSWSAFPFVLARLSEARGQRQKLLVRGRNGASEAQAYAAVEQEAARAAVAHRLPGPRCELAACGRMEWVAPAPGQRRTLVVRVTRLLPPAAKDARLHSTAAASAAVSQLARASLASAGDFLVAPGDAQGAPAAATAAAAK